MPPPIRCVSHSTSINAPHQNLPPRGKVARRKPGRMRGQAVCLLPAAKKPTLQPLISQKSEIFASFSPGRSLTGTALGRKAFSTAVDGKNLPPGGRWLAAGETDEERRNLPKRMHPNKTHPQSISTPLGSPYGRIWRFLRRAGACPRRSGAVPIAPTKRHRTKAFPLGGRWPGESRGGCGDRKRDFPPVAKEPTLQPLISQKSKIFASFSPGRSLTLSVTAYAVPPLPEGEARGAECPLRHGRRRAAAPLPGAARDSAVVRK